LSLANPRGVGLVIVLTSCVDEVSVAGDDHRLAAQLEHIRTAPGRLSIGLGELLVVDVVAEHQLGVLLLAANETDLRICESRGKPKAWGLVGII